MKQETMIPDSSAITGVVLCGGRGLRMGGQDKGLLIYRDQPLAHHAAVALSAVAGHLILNANRSFEAYASLGWPVVPDLMPGFAGPLAGLYTALRQAGTPWVLTLPCDMPAFGPVALRRMLAVRVADDTDILSVQDGDRLCPVIALVHTRLADSLEAYLASGERRVETWFRRHRLVLADFSDAPEVLLNLNSPADMG